jgi:hypothetical protein
MKALVLAGAILFLAIGTAYAAQPADSDYGSCPTAYVEKATAELRKGLTRPTGEPIVWPPRKFSYRASRSKGGQVLAGYLVPVQYVPSGKAQGWFDETQTWALLFRNQEIVGKFDPSAVEELVMPAPTVSVIKDERDWKIGASGKLGNIIFQEWVVAGETIHNWTEMVVAETHNNQPVSIHTFLISKRQSLRRRCANVTQDVISETTNGTVVERTLMGCTGDRGEEHQIARLVPGPRSLTNIMYVRTTLFPDRATKEKWLALLGRARIGGDC